MCWTGQEQAVGRGDEAGPTLPLSDAVVIRSHGSGRHESISLCQSKCAPWACEGGLHHNPPHYPAQERTEAERANMHITMAINKSESVAEHLETFLAAVDLAHA